MVAAIVGAQRFVDFDQQRQSLLNLLDQIIITLERVDVRPMVDKAQTIRRVVQTDTFKVLVIGQFKTGKSTFINALLRDRVLPAYVVPTTAVINEIKWGPEPRAVLHFLPDSLVSREPASSAHSADFYLNRLTVDGDKPRSYGDLIGDLPARLAVELTVKLSGGLNVMAWLSGGFAGIITGLRDVKSLPQQIKQSIGASIIKQTQESKQETTAHNLTTIQNKVSPLIETLKAGLQHESDTFRDTLKAIQESPLQSPTQIVLNDIDQRLERFTNALFDFN